MELVLPKEALDNTLLVAEMCDDYGDMLKSVLRMPSSGYEDPKQEIFNRVLSGLIPESDRYARAVYELNVICALDFADYFLVLADGLDAVRAEGIPVGPGRGSAGGCLVSYLLRITAIDPIELDLSFERFLNADRVSLPDIDIDVPDDRRERVIEIFTGLYNHVAKIGTVGTIGARAAIKDTARVLDLGYKNAEELTWALPRAEHGRQPSLSQIDMAKAQQVKGYREILDLAGPLEGLARQASQHAAGVVISPVPLVEVLPLWNAKVVGKQEMSSPITQWDMHAVEALGLVKYDFLGLNTLGTIASVLQTLRSGSPDELGLSFNYGFGLSDVIDGKTFSLLSAGESVGVFQLDGRGMQNLLRKLAPRSIHDIAAVLALYRPGPMGVNAHWDFADRKNNRKRIQYPNEEFREVLADILGPTYGLIVYQEQVTACLVKICGYSVNEADSVRKAMGKKDRKLLAKEEQRVLGTPGFSKDALQTLWDTLVPFADYAFNKSHAYGYAFVSYWTAYLKANHPKAWFAALLTREGNPEKAKEYMDEVRRLNIAILPPDVNTSDMAWTATEDGIRYGLATIKGIGPKVIKALQVCRPFVSFGDFLRRAPSEVLRLNVFSALLYAGALDSLGSREGIFASLESYLGEARTEREERRKGELGLRTRSFSVPALPADFKWRKAREKEVLGLSISERPTLVVLPSDMGEADWSYVKSAVAANPGMSQLFISVGSWRMPFGTVDSEGILRSLEPLGGTSG